LPSGRRVLKVLDFGISKIEATPGATVEDDLTNTALMLGSPRYMSPEQARNARLVDARSDLWSLGVVLYRLVSGTVPFTGHTAGDSPPAVLTDPLPPLRAEHPEVPRELERVILRCLERDVDRRYANVAELARALAPFASAAQAASADRIAELLPS